MIPYETLISYVIEQKGLGKELIVSVKSFCEPFYRMQLNEYNQFQVLRY